jgi:hypothetical protein
VSSVLPCLSVISFYALLSYRNLLMRRTAAESDSGDASPTPKKRRTAPTAKKAGEKGKKGKAGGDCSGVVEDGIKIEDKNLFDDDEDE